MNIRLLIAFTAVLSASVFAQTTYVGPAVSSPLWQSEGVRVTSSGHSGGLGVDAAGSNWGVSLFQDGVKRLTVEDNGGLLVGSNYVHQNAPANGLAIEGNVGIGTTTPGAKLEVNGGLAIDDFSTLSLRRSQGTGTYAIHFANVGPRHPLRFVGSSDSTTHRYFEFGHYSGESQAGAWNGRVFINSYTGALGIGEPPSLYQFSVNSGSNPYSARIRSAGDFVFALAGDGIAGTNVDLFSIRNNNTVAVHLNAVNGARLALGVSTSTGAGGTAEALTITSQANVGIGTINPTHKLSVNGAVRAKEVIVETTGWSDYVFADDYALKPLAEVEAHIKQHKHLPGIPSAKEVTEEGVSLGEMQARLLAKIEELTLHIIAQEKRIQKLEMENGLPGGKN